MEVADDTQPEPPPREADALQAYVLIVEGMTEGVSLSSEDGVIVYTNTAEDAMFGYARGELVGRHVSVQNAYPEAENQARVAEVIATLQERGVWEGDWRNRRKDGSDFVTASRITAVTLEGRQHWLCVQRDVTEQRRAEAAHRQAEERLQLAVEATGVGIFDLDLTTGEGIWSENAFRMLGYDPPADARGTFEMWRARLHPEDEAEVLAEHGRAEAEGGDLHVEFRVQLPTGEVRWLSAFGRILREDIRIRSIGTVVDVTERHDHERALRDSARRLDLAVTAHGIGIFDWDVPTGRVLWSAHQEQLFGLPPDSFGGDLGGWAAWVHPDDLEPMNAAMAAAMAERRETLDFAFRIVRPDGEVRWIEGAGRFLYAEDGTPLRMVGTNQDVTERRRGEERQRLLLNELNHRVKNTLAIIQSLARQSFKGSSVPAEVRHSFEARLAALSAAHNLLTQESWEAASIRSLCEDALRPHDLERFRIAGPEIRLGPKAAVSLALALHELGTNAAKYGALSVPEGHVGVRWSAQSGRLAFTWRETGGPFVSEPERRGFGTRMIERALAADFGGKAVINFAPEGVICRVDAALPSAA